jgi:dsRNA-specific ribonuclease
MARVVGFEVVRHRRGIFSAVQCYYNRSSLFRYPRCLCQRPPVTIFNFRPCHRSLATDTTTTMRVQKGLPRTILPAPSMSPRALPRAFPPAEALKKPKYNEPDLAVETYSQLQPPDASALVAFAHRIGIASIFSAEHDMPSLVQQALTHSSFAPFHQSHYPNDVPPPTNASLAAMGNSLLGLFATEYIHASYPHLPTRVLKVAVSAHVGPRTCQAIAKEIGTAPLLRWARMVRVLDFLCSCPTLTVTCLLTFQRATPIKPAVLHPDAMASVPRALTGLVYHYRSLPVARKFVHTFFLSREADLRSFIKFRDPKLALSFTVAQFGRERPISRWVGFILHTDGIYGCGRRGLRAKHRSRMSFVASLETSPRSGVNSQPV